MGNLNACQNEHLAKLEQNGFAIYPGFFDEGHMTSIRRNIESYSDQSHPGIIKEEDGVTTRGIHGPHLYDGFFKDLATNTDIVALAESILGEEVYLHQFKINMKHKMNGQAWPWHDDFVYWREKDGIELPTLVNIALFVDESDMLCGPLCFIPGSHKRQHQYQTTDEETLADWENDLSADLNYKLDAPAIDEMINKSGVEYALGKAGDLLVFHPLIAHCSASNLSPHDRRLLILTFNTVSNAPKVALGRPEFLCGTVESGQ